jgi:hypothetical protein
MVVFRMDRGIFTTESTEVARRVPGEFSFYGAHVRSCEGITKGFSDIVMVKQDSELALPAIATTSSSL